MGKITSIYKKAAILTSGIFGVVVPMLGIYTHNVWIEVGGFASAWLLFLLIERIETGEIRKGIEEKQSDFCRRLDHIGSYLKANPPDILKVAIFDHLLIYLPMYVANELGYLKQEGIEVEFHPMHGDQEVAEAIKSTEADIGLCDPCMCARKEFSQPGNSLFVLAPLVTRSAATPVTKYQPRVDSRVLLGGNIKIATFPAPSTTFVMAVNLKEELERKNKAFSNNPIKVELIPIATEQFTIANLSNLLTQHELVMLWDPLLEVAKQQAETVEYKLDANVLPNDLMYSSLVVSQRLLDEKPTLGIRLFRALSRASYSIYLAAKMAEEKPELLSRIVTAANTQLSALSLSDAQLKALIREMVLSKGLFPLITGPEQLHNSPKWREQLYRAIGFRRKAVATPPPSFTEETLVSISSAEDCRRLFCPSVAFSIASPTNLPHH